jgi:hypothetical protein
MKSRLIAHLVVLWLPACLLNAQQGPHPGDRVRLNGPCESTGDNATVDPGTKCRVVGLFLRVAADTVTVSIDGQPKSFAVGSIDRFEVSQGYRSHRTVGGVIGFVAGAGIAYLILNSGGSTSLCDQDANQDAIGSGECLGLVAAGGAIGGGLGIIIGGGIRTERWMRMPIESLRMNLGFGQLGLAVGISF